MSNRRGKSEQYRETNARDESHAATLFGQLGEENENSAIHKRSVRVSHDLGTKQKPTKDESQLPVVMVRVPKCCETSAEFRVDGLEFRKYAGLWTIGYNNIKHQKFTYK